MISKKDLIVLVADRDIEFTLKGLLSKRTKALSIRDLSFDIHTHPNRDSGCCSNSEEFLSPFLKSYTYALVMFDLHGCGKEEALTREKVEQQVEESLCKFGWEDRCAAVVLDPEIEIWIWSDSPEVDRVLGWKENNIDLRSWLLSNNLLEELFGKPKDPKKAFRQTLKKAQKPMSASIFKELSEVVSIDRCTDQSFIKLKTILRKWFPKSYADIKQKNSSTSTP